MYTPRNILLTGGAGFIGSHVVERLLLHSPSYKARAVRDASCEFELTKFLTTDDLQVVVLDKLDYCASLRNLDSVVHLPNLKARRSVCLPVALCIFGSPPYQLRREFHPCRNPVREGRYHIC